MNSSERSFFDLYAQRFVRAGICVPRLTLADPAANAREIADLYGQAIERGAAVVLFPELALSGYSLDDLHQQDALLRAVLEGLEHLRARTVGNRALLVVGAPLRFESRLYNAACVLSDGRLLGIVPKSYLPGYREFYEKRQFAAARDSLSSEVTCLGERVPFGADLLFRDERDPDFCLHAEICEDVWTPIPPSTWAAFRGATVLANLSASNITIGKAGYRRSLASGQSAKTMSAYLYTAASAGESTTDLAWDGHALAYENGALLAESERFAEESQVVFADIDLDRLVQERARMTSFVDSAADYADRLAGLRIVPFRWEPPTRTVRLERHVARHPFVPSDASRRDERCYEAYHIQVSGLVQRLRATGIEKLVIGVSGGLDSTQALIVAARTMDELGLPRSNVLAYTMPGFATSRRTLDNSHALMGALGVTGAEIDIRPSCEQMFRDLDHPFAKGDAQYDVTFENVQAGERTSHLFRLANLHGALVVGTGDLSELALGWCTYGVGDQMSHYNVNVSVPKTLIQHLIAWVADRPDTSAETARVLRDVLATEISPELVPGDDGDGPAQKTEEKVGPYELHDFTLYYVTRRGYTPSKVAFLAAHAWATDVPGAGEREGYELETIFRWQREFLRRFFQTSQFKRSASPNGPKVGSGGSLSPRGDWRAPSDNVATPWLADHDRALDWAKRSRDG